MPVASRDPVPEVNKVIQLCLWGAEEVRDKQQAAKEKEKKQAQREEGREAEKKKETGTTETTAYLQLEGPLPTYNSRHHGEEKRASRASIDFCRFSAIFYDFQRLTMTFNNFQRFSTIFHDFRQFSTIFNDLEVRGAPGPCLGAHKRKIRLFKTIDLGATVMENWPPDCIAFLLFSRFWIYIFAA